MAAIRKGGVVLDDIDRSLVAALSHDGRMPFTEVAGLLGVSSQTVARRYGRLQDRAGLRVVGQVRPGLVGRAQWLLIACRAVQGAAAAMVIPQTIGLIKSMFAGPELSRALGSIGPVMGLAAVLGPVLGGS